MYRKFALSLLACVASGILPANAVTAAYNDGVAFYQAGKFHEAALALAKAAGAEPTNALAHYYFANALVHVGAHQQAAKEYRASLLLEPYGTVSAFCRAALKGYHEPLPTAQDANAIHDTVGGAATAQQSQSSMQRQLAREQARGDVLTASSKTFANSRTKVDFDKVEDVVRERIAALHADYTRPTFGNPYQDNLYLARREEEIRKEAKEDQERIRREAGETAARYKRVADDRQKVLTETARALETQMHENPGKGGVRLLAEGTDLYVRRYASLPSRHPAPPTHAAVVRIYGRGANADANPNPSQIDRQTSDTHARDVRGKVLN
jgi:tetratricopeptide (TPR) repeat protein